MVDLRPAISRFCDIVGLPAHHDSAPSGVGRQLSDGKLLLVFLQTQFPASPWSIYPLSDVNFHGAFIYNQFCVDSGLDRACIPDGFDIVNARNTDTLLISIHHVLLLPESKKCILHSGPLLDDADVCSCLLCRWRSAIRVLSPAAHAWSPAKLPNSIRRLVEDGIPSSVREHAWLILSGGLDLMRTRRPDYISLFPKALVSPHIEQIDLDISRTFQEYPEWRRKGYDVITRRVLAAYSVRNSSIGYCQGLSYIAGLLVTVASEESAFVILAATIEDGLLPPDYYTSLQGAVIDLQVLEKLIVTTLPNLISALEERLSEYSFVSIPWNMCLFATALSIDASIRVWDFLFSAGPCVLFRISLGLLRELETRIIVGRIPMSEVRNQLKKIEEKTNDGDVLMYCLQFDECTNEVVMGLREKLRMDSKTTEESDRKSFLSVVDVVEDSLTTCVSDEGYFGPASSESTGTTDSKSVVAISDRRKRKEARKGVIDGLSHFMGGGAFP